MYVTFDEYLQISEYQLVLLDLILTIVGMYGFCTRDI